MDISGCLSIGERVVWMTDTGSEHGTVKWVGVLPDVTDDNITVGVEFDYGIGSGTGKYSNHRLFYAKQNHASLTPILGIIKEEVCQPEKGDIQSNKRKVMATLKANMKNTDFNNVHLYNRGVNPVSEYHKKEHRNMPLDDAINLVSKNFEDYLREKANPPATAHLPNTPTFAVPTSDIFYLLNLLAVNSGFPVVEIEKIILYLRDRRDKILEAESRRPPTEDS